MSGPGLSVLMPVYNAGRFFRPAVESAVSQFAAPGDELLIQDGGSTDGALDEIARAFADEPRVKIVSEPDDGQPDALQRALGRAANSHVGWLNADDLYYPGALDAVRAAVRREPDVDVVYGNATLFAADERVIRRVVPAEFTVDAFVEHGCHAFSGATFFRTELLREVGGFDRTLHFTMDFELFLRIAGAARRAVKLDETLGGLRYHDASKSGTQSFEFFKEAIRVRLRYARTPAQRRHVYRQMGWRLAGLPLTRVRFSRGYSRLRGTKTF